MTSLRSETGAGSSEVLLNWPPLGAGGHVVAFNGRVYEALCARREHRRPAPLFHAALSRRVGDESYVIEMGPAWGNGTAERGVVVEGPVPPLTWGRDGLGVGEMWNSNSVIAWLLLRSGHDLRNIHPPGRGRAPGWGSGMALARGGAAMSL